MAPDHEWPSFLELQLTATDSDGQADTTSVQLDPRTVDLTFNTAPTGLSLTVNGTAQTSSFQRTVIVGSTSSVAAPTTQTSGGTTYDFVSWSDGGRPSHNITAGATNATYTATYQARVQADLSIQLTGTMGSATQATWTMTARNLGPQTAQSVVVRDVLPAR